MTYDLQEMLMGLGYTKGESKSAIRSKIEHLDLFIEDYTSVSEYIVIRVLDSLSESGIASLIADMDSFRHEEVLEQVPSTPSEEEEEIVLQNISRGISNFLREAMKNGRG